MRRGEIFYPDLTKEEVEEFKRLTREVYQKELTTDQAKDQGARLIMLFELLVEKMVK